MNKKSHGDEKTRRGTVCNIEKFSKTVISSIRYIRNSLYPVSTKSSMGFVIVEGDSLALLQFRKIPEGTLHPVYVTDYKAYKICHFLGLKKASATVCVFYQRAPTKTYIMF